MDKKYARQLERMCVLKILHRWKMKRKKKEVNVPRQTEEQGMDREKKETEGVEEEKRIHKQGRLSQALHHLT